MWARPNSMFPKVAILEFLKRCQGVMSCHQLIKGCLWVEWQPESSVYLDSWNEPFVGDGQNWSTVSLFVESVRVGKQHFTYLATQFFKLFVARCSQTTCAWYIYLLETVSLSKHGLKYLEWHNLHFLIEWMMKIEEIWEPPSIVVLGKVPNGSWQSSRTVSKNYYVVPQLQFSGYKHNIWKKELVETLRWA